MGDFVAEEPSYPSATLPLGVTGAALACWYLEEEIAHAWALRFE